MRRWWWVIGNGVTVAVGLVAIWVNQQPDIYVSSGSYVARAHVTDPSDLVRATATLAASDEIVSTYAGIATSELIETQARDAPGLNGEDPFNTEATSSVVPGTNVLLVGARSRDPQSALDMAVAVGDLTEAYVRDLNGVFFLVALDPPTAPSKLATGSAPTFAGAAILGLLVGLGVARALDRSFPVPRSRARLRNVVDYQSSAHNRRYLELRLSEEVSRSRDLEEPFSLGVLQLTRHQHGHDEEHQQALFTDADLRTVAECMRSSLRDHDILAHLGRGRFVAILPNLDLDEANSLVQKWRKAATEALLRENVDRDVRVGVGACEYDSSLFVGDPEAEFIASQL